MNMTQTTMEISPTGSIHCPKCKAVLPRQAAFCASCGERIPKKTVVSLVYTDIASRYRITSLVRRRPYISLYFAIDSQHQRPVVIREITLRSLQDEARLTASQVVQHEYDLLRHEHIPSVLPIFDLLRSQEQLYIVAGWPTKSDQKTTALQLHTLQDILQSGIGLPKMQTALTWIEQLCGTVDNLHRHQIVLGDLDPQALILDGDTYESELALMAAWLPSAIRNLLPPTSSISSPTNFSAPEVLLDTPEPRSDVYSLGAILYLLLTGIAPDEPPVRMQRGLRSPNELNFRISHALDEFVMQALALEPADRFQSIREMGEALYYVRAGIKRISTRRAVLASLPTVVEAAVSPTPTDESAPTKAHSHTIDEIFDIKTVLITPLPSTSLKARQEMNIPTTDPQSEAQDASLQAPDTVEDKLLPPRTIERNARDLDTPVPTPPIQTEAEHTKNSLADSFKQRITGILPAIPRSPKLPVQTPKQPTPVVLVPPAVPSIETEVEGKSAKDRSLLKQLQRLILGEQKQVTTAAAIIETPLRIQPNQSYTIRIHLMGRDQSRYPHPVEAHKGARVGGLSSLVEGETVYIEVRSALYQSYAYIVQQATVSLPGQDYAAEVTIPMQPLSTGPNGRRDRLHIFFMDDRRHPLYEKPFVVELFVSHLVQPGREGHNVLTIPL